MNDAARVAIVIAAIAGGIWASKNVPAPEMPTVKDRYPAINDAEREWIAQTIKPEPEPAKIVEPEPAPVEVPIQQPAPAGAVEWVTEANLRDAMQRTGKPAWLLFTGPLCSPCEVVKEVVLVDPQAIEATKDFVCVKMKPSRASAWGIRTIPRSVFCDYRNGRLLIIRLDGERSTVTPTAVQAFIRQLRSGFSAVRGALPDKFT